MEILGFSVALLCGVLVGIGRLDVLLWVLLGVVVLGVIAWAFQVVVASPRTAGFWLFGVAVFCVTWSGVRVSGGATLSDVFLLLSPPFAIAGFLDRFTSFRLPWWLLSGAGLLALAIFIHEVLPQSEVLTPVQQAPAMFSFQDASGSSLSMGIRLLVALIGVPLVATFLVRDWGQIRVLANLWIFGIFVSCLVAVLDFSFGTGLQVSLGSSDLSQGAFGANNYGVSGADVRYVGLTFHPVALSISSSMAVPLVLSRMFSLRKAALYLPVLLVILGASLLSGSRTSILLFFVTAAIFLVWKTSYAKPLVLWIGIFILVLFVLKYGGVSVVPERFLKPGEFIASNQARVDNFGEGMSLFLSSPVIGHGFEYARQAHNIALQLLASGGFAALIGYYLVTLGYLREGIRVSQLKVRELGLDLVGVTVAFAVFLIAGVVSNTIFERYLYVPAGIIMAAAMLSREARMKRRLSRTQNRPRNDVHLDRTD